MKIPTLKQAKYALAREAVQVTTAVTASIWHRALVIMGENEARDGQAFEFRKRLVDVVMGVLGVTFVPDSEIPPQGSALN